MADGGWRMADGGHCKEKEAARRAGEREIERLWMLSKRKGVTDASKQESIRRYAIILIAKP
jgi:hypothetical protein